MSAYPRENRVRISVIFGQFNTFFGQFNTLLFFFNTTFVPKICYKQKNIIIMQNFKILITMVFTAFASVTTQAANGNWGGDGSQSNPYTISDATDLATLATNVNNGNGYSGKYFLLTANISGYTGVPIGGNSTTFGGVGQSFNGIFDGNYHTIISPTIIANNSYSNVGLFGIISGGTVKNLGIVGGTIQGSYYVGGMAGYIGNNGQIINCFNTAAVTASGSVGGLVGCIENGQIIGCYNTGAVSGGNQTGGVSGTVGFGGVVENCYNTGAVSGGSQTGGVAGAMGGNGPTDVGNQILNCYNAGAVNGDGSNIGGVLGRINNDGTNTITGCYYDNVTCNKLGIGGILNQTDPPADVSGSAEGKTTAEMQTQSTFVNWDFIGVWYMPANDYPHFPWELQPAIVGTSPGQGATDAPLNGNIVIVFNKPMDPTSGTVALTEYFGGATAGSLSSGSWTNDNSRITFQYSGLSPSTSYTVNISGFKDTFGKPVTTPGSYSFTTQAGSSATRVTANAGYGGSLTPNGGPGTYTVTPNSGFVIDQVFVDGDEKTEASGLSTYSVTILDDGGAHSIFATFGYTVNFNTPTNGSLVVSSANVNLSSGTLVHGGQILTATATPANGYLLENLTLNGVDVTNDYNNGYTYTVGTSGAKRTLSDGTTEVSAQGADIAATMNVALPHFITWKGTVDTDWNNSSNWEPESIPASRDTVFIPGDSPNFPILANPVSVAEIHFKPGAQIKGQSNLTGKTFVQYDLSRRERWNMLSMPLEEAYPGDFVFGGYPNTWVRTFETSAGAGSTTKGSWNTAYGRTTAFTAGDGFVLWVNADDDFPDGQVDDAADKGLKLLNDTLELPFFYQNNALCQNVHPTHDYDDVSGKSTFYNFAYSNGKYVLVPDQNYTVPRTDAAYQLAGTSLTKNLNFGENTEAGSNVALVGNPYMAGLDFEALCTDVENNGVIKPSYQVWTGNGYSVYTGNGYAGDLAPTGNLNQFIAPLQAFLVEKPETQLSNALKLKEEMTTVTESVGLRSSAGKENKLDIIARNPAADVLTFIAKRDGGQDSFGDLDARKIMNEISQTPEVYTLKPCKSNLIAAAVNIIDNDDVLIPIGLATSYTGDITLSFSGMDSYDANISLIDAENNRTINLTGLVSYDYVVNYTPKEANGNILACENRFFIQISKSVTKLPEIVAEKVNVFEDKGIIHVISDASNPIKKVDVYNLQGRLMYRADAINAVSYTINRNLPAGAYVVNVILQNSIDNVKLILQ